MRVIIHHSKHAQIPAFDLFQELKGFVNWIFHRKYPGSEYEIFKFFSNF